MKSQKGNVIFVMLTPARGCCVTPLFYTHHLQLEEDGWGCRRRGWQLSEEMCCAGTSVDVVGGAESRTGERARRDANLPELKARVMQSGGDEAA